MNNMVIYSSFGLIFLSLLLFAVSLMFVESDMSEISETSFECGFEAFFMPRIPFSIHFFTVTIVFLIFDLEIVILLPIIFNLSGFLSIFINMVMIFLLAAGLIYEWYDSSLSWQIY